VRLGCGCLLFVLVVLGAIGAAGWAGLQMLRQPDEVVAPAAATREDAARAQEKLYAIVTGRGRASGGGAVVITQAELNAFLARNLVEIGDLPVSDTSVILGTEGLVEIRGRLPLSYLVKEVHGDALASILPSSWLERRVSVTLVANVRVEAAPGTRRYLRLDVRRFSIGRQPLPAMTPRLVLAPSALRWFRWSLPGTVEDVRVEKGRVVVRTAA
jgi:hypothetical protein